MNTTSYRPQQKVSRAAKNPDWYKESGMYFKGACKPAINREEALKWYRLANGELLEEDYLYVTNPLNTTRVELQGYPAKMKNHDIISPNLNTLMGEKIKRIFPPIVYARNTDYQSRALEYEQNLMIQEAQKMFVNEIVAQGIKVDPEQVQKPLEEIAARIKNLPDELSIIGQNALEYIIDYNDIIRNFKKGFYDYLCTAMVFSYKDVHKNKTRYEIISGINLAYLAAPSTDFIEDGDAIRALYPAMSVNEIYDRFQDVEGFNDEVKDFIDHFALSQGGGLRDNAYDYSKTDIIARQHELYRNVFGQLPEEKYAMGIDVEHIMWRSFIKLGKITGKDFFNNKTCEYVSEDYVVSEGEEVEWEWVDEICEVYCINDKYYIGGNAIPIQRGEYDNPHKAKLLYNGRTYFARHTKPTSIVKKGESYQKSVNIIKYRAEESLAKNLDKIILFPLGLIPKQAGWSEEKMMYYVRAFSFLFFDDTRPGAAQMVNAMKDLNLSMTDHILKSYELVAMFKNEWDEVCGINRQRKGEISASAGRGVTQDAMQASYTMSEELFVSYEEFERREYTGFLELSKYAFSDGINAHFLRMDGQKAFLNIHDPETYVASDLGVFVKNGSREINKLGQLKAQATQFAQNGASPKAVTGIIEKDNFAEIHKIMDEVEAKTEARFQQEQQVQLQIQQSTENIAAKQLEYKYYDTDFKGKVEIQVALIDQGIKISQDLNSAVNSGKVEDINAQKDLLEQNAIELIKNSTELKKIASQERIAKDKNATAIKNKVSGEK